jgi:hypothetical protein
VNICSTFVSNPKPSELASPRMSSFNYPAITSKTVFRFDPFACNARANATFSARTTTSGIVIPFVGVQFVGTESRPAPRTWNGRNTIQQVFQGSRVVDISSRQQTGQRNALSIDEKMVLRARFAFVRGVGARRFAPFFAATVAESTDARLQSISPARPNFSKNRRCKFCQTPASCHSWSRRQQVMPLPQPISLGSISQGMPLRRTKRMPVKVARSDMRGRPPFGFGFSGGNSGATYSHSLSSRRGRILRPSITRRRFC